MVLWIKTYEKRFVGAKVYTSWIKRPSGELRIRRKQNNAFCFYGRQRKFVPLAAEVDGDEEALLRCAASFPEIDQATQRPAGHFTIGSQGQRGRSLS